MGKEYITLRCILTHRPATSKTMGLFNLQMALRVRIARSVHRTFWSWRAAVQGVQVIPRILMYKILFFNLPYNALASFSSQMQ